MTDLALLRRFPELAERLPRVPLGRFPTPVERAPALGAEVWVKRDDRSGDSYGGNKVRKLEWVLADAGARGRRSLLTIGGTGSNHVLATALYAREAGFAATHAVLFPQPPSDAVDRRLATFRDLGVHESRVPGKLTVPFGVLARVVASLARGGGWPYLIGPGASSPLGTVGYVNAALELAEQVAAGELPVPGVVYVPLGSGGTVAGLTAGFRLAGLGTRVRAVRVVPAPWVSPRGAMRLAGATLRLLAARGASIEAAATRFSAVDVDDVTGQLGAGYGAATPAAIAAVERAREAGLRLETTYSGKALATLLAAQASGEDAGKRVLFWNTFSGMEPSP